MFLYVLSSCYCVVLCWICVGVGCFSDGVLCSWLEGLWRHLLVYVGMSIPFLFWGDGLSYCM